MKELVKKLFLLQLTHNGIPDDIYHFLKEDERKLLSGSDGKFFLRDEERAKITVVLTGGVFDILHIGHIVTLNEAKKYGDVLVVILATDNHIRKKGREPIHQQEYRKIMVESLKPVDLALSGLEKPKDSVDRVKPDVIVYGYDQSEFIKPENVKIVKLSKKIDDSKFKTGKILGELGV